MLSEVRKKLSCWCNELKCLYRRLIVHLKGPWVSSIVYLRKRKKVMSFLFGQNVFGVPIKIGKTNDNSMGDLWLLERAWPRFKTNLHSVGKSFFTTSTDRRTDTVRSLQLVIPIKNICKKRSRFNVFSITSYSSFLYEYD